MHKRKSSSSSSGAPGRGVLAHGGRGVIAAVDAALRSDHRPTILGLVNAPGLENELGCLLN